MTKQDALESLVEDIAEILFEDKEPDQQVAEIKMALIAYEGNGIIDLSKIREEVSHE